MRMIMVRKGGWNRANNGNVVNVIGSYGDKEMKAACEKNEDSKG